MKMLLGNLLFGSILVAWYFYVGNKVQWFLPGMVLAFASFLGGTFMGYLLRGPGKSRRTVNQDAATRLYAAGSSFVDPAAYRPVPPLAMLHPGGEPSRADPALPDIPGPDDLDDLEVVPETPTGGSEPARAETEEPTDPIPAAPRPAVMQKAGHHTEEVVADTDFVATLE